MFDSLFNLSISTILVYIILIILSVITGFALAFSYKKFKNKRGFDSDVVIMLCIIPSLVSILVMLSRVIGLSETASRTTMGFSLAGIICICRIRSVQKDLTDITYISSALIIGFILGLGYVMYGLILEIVTIIVFVVVSRMHFNLPNQTEMELKITVPEDLNFDHLFDDILKEYTKYFNLKQVKTTDFGTLFELDYIISLNNNINEKEFIDKIRERNGNLNIVLSTRKYN